MGWDPENDDPREHMREVLKVAEKLADAMQHSSDVELEGTEGILSMSDRMERISREQMILALAGRLFPYLDITGVLDVILTDKQKRGEKLTTPDPNVIRGEASVLVALAMEQSVRNHLRPAKKPEAQGGTELTPDCAP